MGHYNYLPKPSRIARKYPREWATVGGLSNPSKMPCFGISLPASACDVGSKLVKIPGSVCSGCYALKGFYRMNPTKPAMARRLRQLRANLRSGRWAQAMVRLISSPEVGSCGYFRWHDSGDLQSLEHLAAISLIAAATPQVQHWLPTREAKIVQDYLKIRPFPKNLTVRLSLPMLDMERPSTFDSRIVTSTAHTTTAPGTARECPAHTQNNECRDCRSCWDQEVKHVSYRKH